MDRNNYFKVIKGYFYFACIVNHMSELFFPKCIQYCSMYTCPRLQSFSLYFQLYLVSFLKDN